MDQRINIITLGVADLDRARRFYCQGLGWQASKAGNEHIVMLRLGSLILSLYDRGELAKDACVQDRGPGSFDGVTLAQNVSSKAMVDQVLKDALAAGAKLLKPAQEVFWGGYSGYFADPDGHAWEVAFNPHWQLDAQGQVLLPG